MTVMVLIGVAMQRAMYTRYMHASALNRHCWEEEEATRLHKKGKMENEGVRV